MIKVLVTSVGSVPGIAVIKALRAQKEIPLKIIGLDMNPLSAGFFLADRSYVIPHSQKTGFIPALIKICKKERASCLFPIIDEELLHIAEKRALFENLGCKVIINSPEVLRRTRDKYATYQFCLKNRILTPKTILIREVGHSNPMDFPVILKPRDGRGTKGVFKARNVEEFRFYRRNLLSGLVQQYIPGKEYTIDILARPDGEILCAIPRERIETKSGVSYKGRINRDRKLSAYGIEVAGKFGINGPCNIQCIVKGDELYLIEVNPKFGAGISLTVAAGVNIPFILLKMRLGKKVRPSELKFKDGLYMLRYWEEVFVREEVIPKSYEARKE